MARVLGLDPGLRRTGWGVIETAGNRLRHVGHGVVATDSGASVPERLCDLHEGLVEIVGDENHGFVEPMFQIQELFLHFNFCEGIQSPKRLIE